MNKRYLLIGVILVGLLALGTTILARELSYTETERPSADRVIPSNNGQSESDIPLNVRTTARGFDGRHRRRRGRALRPAVPTSFPS